MSDVVVSPQDDTNETVGGGGASLLSTFTNALTLFRDRRSVKWIHIVPQVLDQVSITGKVSL